MKASNISRASLSLPTERIGSKTNAVNAVIDNIVLTSKVVKEDLTEGVIDSKDFTVTADNENSDGKITNAFDNNISTIWHTQWSPDKKPLPAVITIDMKKNYDINGFYYMPRQTGNNGYILEYTLEYQDASGNWQKAVDKGTWASNGSEKNVRFKPINTSKLRLTVTKGQNDFGSAAEFKVLGGTEDLTKVPLRISAYVEGNGTASVSKNEIIKGEEVTFTAETKNGSTFVGWYDVLGNEVSKEASYKVIPEDNLTLIAKFEGGEKPVDPENPVDKSALEKYYNECVAYYKENDYTVDSWKVYEAALANAKAVLDDKDATVEEIKEATEKLAKAAKDLVKKEENKKPEEFVLPDGMEKPIAVYTAKNRLEAEMVCDMLRENDIVVLHRPAAFRQIQAYSGADARFGVEIVVDASQTARARALIDEMNHSFAEAPVDEEELARLAEEQAMQVPEQPMEDNASFKLLPVVAGVIAVALLLLYLVSNRM